MGFLWAALLLILSKVLSSVVKGWCLETGGVVSCVGCSMLWNMACALMVLILHPVECKFLPLCPHSVVERLWHVTLCSGVSGPVCYHHKMQNANEFNVSLITKCSVI